MAEYFGRNIPVSRVLINTAGALGGIGATTNLLPSLTLGCGAIGGSATSENVGPLQLMNIRYVAHGARELEDILAAMPKAGTTRQEEIDPAVVDAIVKRIIARFQTT
jgi:hypothetical protein